MSVYTPIKRPHQWCNDQLVYPRTVAWWDSTIKLYSTSPPNQMFKVLTQWNKSPQVDMSLHSDTLSWFRGNRSSLLLLTCSVEESTYQLYSGARTSHHSGAPEFISDFEWRSCSSIFSCLCGVFSGVSVTRSLVLCVCFIDHCLSFCPFSFVHCVVCSSSKYGFWLPLWYLRILYHR